jgi:O-antigen ligase
MELPLTQKLFYFFPVLFCFCLPFGSIALSGIIALWLITSFFNIHKKSLKEGLLNKNLILLYLLFLITIISALTSSNLKEGLAAIEIKFSFLVFPYLLFCFQWPKEIIKRCLTAFVSGCFFASIYLIGRSAFYALNGNPEYFFYTLFSDFIHASYFAMYLIMAIAIIILFYHQWFETQKTVVYSSYVFVAIFTTAIFLCSSKLGLISFFISIPVLFFYKLKALLNLKKILWMLLGFGFLVFVAAKILPNSFNRFNSISSLSFSKIDKTSAESTTVRVLIWEQALQLIKSNFFTGTGVGDANDELYFAYQKKGLTGAFEHKLNAHNQFFQTFIGLGIFGFIILLLITFGQFVKALMQKKFLLLIFSVLIILNFMVESMLQSVAGVLFYSFFFCLFNVFSEKDLLSD